MTGSGEIAIPSDHRAAWATLGGLMLAFAALFVAYYPPIAGIEDEVGFLNQALVWSRGAVSAEGAGYPDGLVDFFEHRGRHVPGRHPGRSLVVLPFLAVGGVSATFASGLLIHLAMTAVGAALLVRLGRSPLWAVLLLFHPTLAIYSRTIMADGPAGAALLLAGLGVVRGAPVGAGLAVGLAAAMRNHAALMLPVVAGSFVYPNPLPARARGDRWRAAAVCLAAGAAVGGCLVAYNLVVYGTPGEPFTAQRGVFLREAFWPHLAFYAGALLLIWPGMLPAPLLDASPLRWLTRGAILVFLGPLLFYYFHDQAPGRLATAVLGQRLLQVALPLWVVSYAGVVDDWVARPLRRRIGPGAWRALVAAVCLGMLAGTGLMFDRHQAHLRALRAARDAVTERVPEGSLVVFGGSFHKLVGTPVGIPAYRLHALDWMQGRPIDPPEVVDHALASERSPWYLAVLRKAPGEPLSPYLRDLVERQHLPEIPLGSPLVSLFGPGRRARP